MVEVDQAELAVVEVAATRSNRLVRANRLDTLRRWCLLVVAVAVLEVAQSYGRCAKRLYVSFY